MNVKVVDRKYIIGGRWLRFEVMRGVMLVGWKVAVGRYEIRFYLNILNDLNMKHPVNEKKTTPPLPFDLLDNEGYPTTEWLEFIEKYKPSEELPYLQFIELLRQSWWMDDCLFVLHRKHKGKRKLELHTGGWSGNEDIIEAMRANIFLTHHKLRYEMWKAGGHHYFELHG